MSRTATPFRPDDVFDLAWAGAPQMSFDGQYAACTVDRFDRDRDRRASTLRVRPADDLDRVLLEVGSPRVFAWSPDEQVLYAVVSADDGSDGGAELVAHRFDRAEVSSSRTALPFAPAEIAIGPGRAVALYGEVEVEPDTFGVDLSDIGSERKPQVVSHMRFRGEEGDDEAPTRPVLAVVQVGSGEVKEVPFPEGCHPDPTEDVNGVELGWFPDGSALIACLSTGWDDVVNIAARQRDIYRLGIDDGAAVPLTTGGLVHRGAAFSPDGTRMAYLRQRGDAGAPFPYFMDVAVLDLASGAEDVLTGAEDVDTWAVGWLSDDRLCYTYPQPGGFAIAEIAGVARRVLTDEGLPLVAIAPSGDIGFVRRTPTTPDQGAVLRPDGSLLVVEHPNDDLGRRPMAELSEIRYPSAHRDREEIHAVVARPPGVTDSRHLPVIVDLHGGPYGASTTGFSVEREVLAAAGFVIVQPNYRGSSGFGEHFARLGDWRRYPGWYDDPDAPHEMGLDVVGVLEAIRVEGLGDPERVYLRGFSAGALLTTWTIGRTDGFRAAVAESWYSGEWSGASYGWFQLRYYFDGPPWSPEHTAEYWRSSPIMLADRVHTPLLLMQGECDYVTPLLEAEKYYYAMRSRDLDVVLAVYPHEGHGIQGHPASQRDSLLMELGWFADHGARAAGSEPELVGSQPVPT